MRNRAASMKWPEVSEIAFGTYWLRHRYGDAAISRIRILLPTHGIAAFPLVQIPQCAV